ncbi:senescence-associated carboxylesterase 101-like protein, partial [Tanacetum coccineum]
INQAAVDLFDHLFVELADLQYQLIDDPLVITGRSLGGYIAILFTIWLQHVVDVKESNGDWGSKRPICITFGSPLIGDEALQRGISEYPQWKSCFFNVVAKTDNAASFFSLYNSQYKPFGIFLFCTESGGHTVFEEQDSILAVLDEMASSRAEHMDMHDYGDDLKSIRRSVLYRRVSNLGEFNMNPLRAGITLQFSEIGMLITQNNNTWNDLINKIEEKQARMMRMKRYTVSPIKKLSQMEISMMYMEWYIKVNHSKGGYYNAYNMASTMPEINSKQIIVTHNRMLDQYWNKTVEEYDKMPQKKGAKLGQRWLYSGIRYMSMFEPLIIAEHYRKGYKNYIATRPNHFKLLEKWSIEDKTANGRTNMLAGHVKDSCFWAYVEEASVSLKDLEEKGSCSSAADITQGLQKFESNVQVVVCSQCAGSSLKCFMSCRGRLHSIIPTFKRLYAITTCKIDVPVSLASWHILQGMRIKIQVPVSLTNYSCSLGHVQSGFDCVENLAGT